MKRAPRMTSEGWLTCANCSSLGLDCWVGQGTAPKAGKCSSCDGPWPYERPVRTAKRGGT